MTKNILIIIKSVICILLVASAASFIMNFDFIDFETSNGSQGFFGSLGGNAKELFDWTSQYFD